MTHDMVLVCLFVALSIVFGICWGRMWRSREVADMLATLLVATRWRDGQVNTEDVGILWRFVQLGFSPYQFYKAMSDYKWRHVARQSFRESDLPEIGNGLRYHNRSDAQVAWWAALWGLALLALIVLFLGPQP